MSRILRRYGLSNIKRDGGSKLGKYCNVIYGQPPLAASLESQILGFLFVEFYVKRVYCNYSLMVLRNPWMALECVAASSAYRCDINVYVEVPWVTMSAE